MRILDQEGNPTKELFVFLKYNQTVESVESLPQSEEEMYNEFCNKWNDLLQNLDSGLSAASSLGSLFSMFGFKRHYCSTCGLPIIGKFSKIGNRVTCDPCFQSFKIIQEMEKKNEARETIEHINGKLKPAVLKRAKESAPSLPKNKNKEEPNA